MSRARNIKPGFFKNDQLAECHPLARILFIGLWCEADREGRVEDRPRRLKAECLPYDDCDANALLDDLQQHGFIQRYEVAGKRFLCIPKFAKHQMPHHKEVASTIPGPPSKRTDDSTTAIDSDTKTLAESTTFNGQSNVDPTLDQDQVNESAPCPTDSPFLIPDSPILIPPSGVTDACASVVDSELSTDPAGEATEDEKPPAPGSPTCPHQAIVGIYHEVLPQLSSVRVWTDKRRDMLRRRWAEDPKRQSLGWWRGFFEHVAASDFLTGKIPGRDGRTWAADFEWLICPSNFVKVLEGRYDNDEVAA